jgi:hypothetical protein
MQLGMGPSWVRSRVFLGCKIRERTFGIQGFQRSSASP